MIFVNLVLTFSFVTADAVYGPQNPVDWQLFHNLVELIETILKAIEPKERLQNLVDY